MHIEILSTPQRKAVELLGKALTDSNFYLAGGTALSLQVGHRRSVDLDWFIPRLGEAENLFQRLRFFGIDFKVLSVSLETVYLTIQDVQISFIGYNYPMLQQTVTLPEFGIQMAATDDIACMKLSAITSRGSRKDFVDLHYLIRHFHSLEDYLRLYAKKYDNRDIGHVVKSLVYFADAEVEPEIKLIKPVLWQDLKADFEKWVKDLEYL